MASIPPQVPFKITDVKFKMLDGRTVYSGKVTCPICIHSTTMIVWPIGWWTSAECHGCKKEFSHPLHYCNQRTDSECHCVDVSPEDLIVYAQTGVKPLVCTDITARCKVLESLNGDLTEENFELKYRIESLVKEKMELQKKINPPA